TGDTSSLTFTGPISLSTSAGRTIANNLGSGQTLTLGSAGSPSTITGSTSGGATLTISMNAAGNNMVINDLMQDSSPSTPMPVTITGGTGNTGCTVTLAALNTYSS